MALTAGTRIGPYEILAPIGAGGMGEVYRAHDSRVGRDVAIKVSTEQFSERFEREIHAVASLNHSNICHLYDVGPNYLVMELIDGPTLAERIKQGAIPLEESLEIARQIADALEAAHEKGIVHRDLKPANIKIRPDGTVKVLDFGLAKVGGTPVVSSENSPTLSVAQTAAGVILGTAAYMSPEQAKGKTVDKRADIWAFGCVLYEMLTGKQLFSGESVSDILASVIKEDPNWERVPAKVRPLLRRCLEKDPKRRLRDIGDGMPLLEGLPESAPAKRPCLAWSIAALLFVTLAPIAFLHFREVPSQAPVLRSSVLAPDKTAFDFLANRGPLAISPDGRRLVFAVTSSDNKSQLWVRPLDAISAQPLLGTEGATFPFWSPDSRFVGFFVGGKLKKIDISGGPPVTLADAPNARGGSWSPEGVIVFAPEGTSGSLQRVSAAGGISSLATTLDKTNGTNHRFPWFLPDGKHFIYAGESQEQTHGRIILNVASLDSKENKVIGVADSNAEYSEGNILFLRENTLMAQPFDAKRLVTTDEAVPIAEQLQYVLNPGTVGCFSVSTYGMLAYQAGVTAGGQKLTWFDRAGKPAATVGDAAEFSSIAFSPDRKNLAASILDRGTGNTYIWVYDLSRGLPSRFTFAPAQELNPIWLPDGRAIVFASSRKGHLDLYRKSSNGAGTEELLFADDFNKLPNSCSPDGMNLLYVSGSALWVLPLSGDRKPFPFLKTPFNGFAAQFSPNGRWVAYMSNESQRFEIYVVPFRGAAEPPGGKRQISTTGGTFPRWRSDGKEIYYIGLDNRLMAAEVNTKSDTLEVGVVRSLFGPLRATGIGYAYDVSADGQRILAVVEPERKTGEPLTLVQNWTAGLKK